MLLLQDILLFFVTTGPFSIFFLDIDECESSNCIKGCINTIGSYYCEENFQNDHFGNVKMVCPPLEPPKFGFITCQRNKTENFGKNGRNIVANFYGTRCRIECPQGFKLVGNGRFVCGNFGKWRPKKGFCTSK